MALPVLIGNNRQQPDEVRAPHEFIQEQAAPLDIDLQQMLAVVEKLLPALIPALPKTPQELRAMINAVDPVMGQIRAKIGEFTKLEPGMQAPQREMFFKILEEFRQVQNWVDMNIRAEPPANNLEGRVEQNGEELDPTVVQALLLALQNINVQQILAQGNVALPQQQPLAPQRAVQQQNPQPNAPQQAAPQQPAPQATLDPTRVSLIQKIWSPIKKCCLKIWNAVVEILRCILPGLFKKNNTQPPQQNQVNHQAQQQQVIQPPIQEQQVVRQPVQQEQRLEVPQQGQQQQALNEQQPEVLQEQ